MLLIPQSDTLRDQVLGTIRKHWVTPRMTEQPMRVPSAKVEEVARATLDTMLTRQFRVGPLPSPEVHAGLLERVRLKVERGLPIRVTIGYSPLKNQNAVPYSRADWAEFFALSHLVAWHNKVTTVYPPGLCIRIMFDDTTLVMANRADAGLMKSYINSVADLIRVLKFDPIFMPPMRQSRLSWIFHFGFYQVARWRVRRWERHPANQAQLERMTEYARRNLVLPPGLSQEQQEKQYREASHRYRVYWEALQLSGFTRRKFRVVAMYLDGTQHHLPHPVAMHLTTLDKGQVTQPWQGEGCLLDNGRGKLEPFVLTAGRRARHALCRVDGLNIVPYTGFERLTVASQIDSISPAPAEKREELERRPLLRGELVLVPGG